MTDNPSLPLPDPAAIAPELNPVQPAYVQVIRAALLIGYAPLAIGAGAADVLAISRLGGPVGLLTAAAVLVLVAAVLVLPARRYQRWGYAMGADQLRVAHGYIFRTDTIVPFVRVQHIDVGQGPIERWFGLAHLVVHTAGTHNSTVTLPGLMRAEAEAMRATIGARIRSDFA